jgi:hypothetical protein
LCGLCAKALTAKDTHKKCLLFVVGSVCFVGRFHLGGKSFTDDEEVVTEMQKWLTQESKDFYALGFDTLVKQWGNCINVDGGYGKK